MKLQDRLITERKSKAVFELAKQYAYNYMDNIDQMEVYPSDESLKLLENFDEPLPQNSETASAVLKQLNRYGSPNTIAQTGGRYFGFVNGNAVPASLGVKWLTDVWDQNGALFVMSPINAKLEAVCESWLKELLGLPSSTVAAYVSGSSTANLCGIAAARHHLLEKQGWDVNKRGLNGAPAIRIIAHEQLHLCVQKTLALLGLGTDSVEWVAADEQGRIKVNELPKLDSSCLVILQAGNVNTGAFDDFNTICKLAQDADAWVHIDGAFGLWAAASKALKHLTKGMEMASSWAVDGHKTLNTPYDAGIVLCKHPDALLNAMKATGAYLTYSEMRDPAHYGPELSKRCRAIEVWATIKSLGRNGIDEMIHTFNLHAQRLANGLESEGLELLNEVVFNQVLVRHPEEAITKTLLAKVQSSGHCWMGSTNWQGKTAIRISVCSWATTTADIDSTIDVFRKALQ